MMFKRCNSAAQLVAASGAILLLGACGSTSAGSAPGPVSASDATPSAASSSASPSSTAPVSDRRSIPSAEEDEFAVSGDWIVGKGYTSYPGDTPQSPIVGYNWRTHQGWAWDPFKSAPSNMTDKELYVYFAATADGVAVVYNATTDNGMRQNTSGTVITTLNPADGSVKYSCTASFTVSKTLNASQGHRAAKDGNLYVEAHSTSDDQDFARIDPKSCTKVWTARMEGAWAGPNSPVLVQNTNPAKQTPDNQRLQALDPATGTELWSLDNVTQLWGITEKAVVVKSLVTSNYDDGTMLFLDPNTGQVLFTQPLTPMNTPGKSDPNTGVAFVEMSGGSGKAKTLTAYQTPNGAQLWTMGDLTAAPANACEGRLWMVDPNKSNLAWALDGKTGDTLAEKVQVPVMCLDASTGLFTSSPGVAQLPPLK